MDKYANMKPVMSETHNIGNDWGWFVDTDKFDNFHYKKQNIYISNCKINYNLKPRINYNFTEPKSKVVIQIKRQETEIFINENKNENNEKENKEKENKEKETKEKQTIYTIKKVVKIIKQTFINLSYSAICGVLVTYIIYYGV